MAAMTSYERAELRAPRCCPRQKIGSLEIGTLSFYLEQGLVTNKTMVTKAAPVVTALRPAQCDRT